MSIGIEMWRNLQIASGGPVIIGLIISSRAKKETGRMELWDKVKLIRIGHGESCSLVTKEVVKKAAKMNALIF
jgi:hypothetical protein